MSLRDQKVVIVGGTSGIGLAVAKAASAEGASIVVASRNQERLTQASSMIENRVETYQVDVTDEKSIQLLFDQVGEFNHLVTTPGNPVAFDLFLNADLSVVNHQFAVKFWGQYLCAKYGARNIKADGSITFMSGGGRWNKGNSTLASINGAIDALSQILAVELAPIRVNVVRPGLVKTDLWSNFSEEERLQMYETASDNLLVGRVGTPEDIAESYLYLLKNTFTTGTAVIVDGGAS
ncbi:SDR family oxidoreductase [Leptolyngbya sp. FACHB-261]|uniref:SDR family oxidoreductase n=1 Tax=Leptolyngbya sp. FACHB-261 TaxID=2692806 RepID=UPI001684E5EF|nr:SDR family oxidoreductase [Leptolyngbya sp. FACHB-261]MBD2102893.1 SDR family oxidoreductase [Leptolyngbya sp. FACHB-261]